VGSEQCLLIKFVNKSVVHVGDTTQHYDIQHKEHIRETQHNSTSAIMCNLFIVMLNVIMLSVVMLCVVGPSMWDFGAI
jgi:hypothetical protein